MTDVVGRCGGWTRADETTDKFHTQISMVVVSPFDFDGVSLCALFRDGSVMALVESRGVSCWLSFL